MRPERICALLPALLLGCAEPAEPGLLVVVLDTTRADLGGAVLGLDLSEARIYTHAYSASSATPASTGTILTGLLPLEHGVTKTPQGAVKLDNSPGDCWPEAFITDNPWAAETARAMCPDMPHRIVGAVGNLPAVRAEDVARKTAGMIADGYRAVHAQPLTGHRPVGGRSLRDQLCYELPITVSDWWREQYALAVSDTVSAFAPIIADRLEAGWTVMLTSDHGEALGEDGLWGHGTSLHDAQVRVPLVVWGPGVVHGEDPTPIPATCVGQTARVVLGDTTPGLCNLGTGEITGGPPVAGMMEGGTWEERVILAPVGAL